MQTILRNVTFLLFCTALMAGIALAQEPAAKTARVLGEVTAADIGAIIIKTDAGASSTVTLDEKTSYLRIPPGETDLKKATKIDLKDVSVGDRVLVRSRLGEDQKPGPATSVIVMTKADLTKKQETEKLEWQRRGVSGTITAMNPDRKEVTVSARSRGETKSVVVESSDSAQYRRYSPDSIRFSDAKPSTFADLKVGDQMRVLGDKNQDGSRIKPEMVISGSFHNIAGTVTTVDAASGEVKINNLQTKKPLTVKVTPDSTLKRVPPEMGIMLARMQQSTVPGGAVGMPGGRGPDGAPQDAPGSVNRPRMPQPGTPGSGMIPGGGGRMGGGRGGDFSQMVERMPVFSLSELKPGDAIIVASSVGPDPNRITAITLLAGVEPLLTAPAGQANRQLNASWNFDINIVP
jgi:hypothetical protein